VIFNLVHYSITAGYTDRITLITGETTTKPRPSLGLSLTVIMRLSAHLPDHVVTEVIVCWATISALDTPANHKHEMDAEP